MSLDTIIYGEFLATKVSQLNHKNILVMDYLALYIEWKFFKFLTRKQKICFEVIPEKLVDEANLI